MILTPAPMMRALADDDVAGDLGGREQHGRVGDGGRDAPVLVELTHVEALRSRSDVRGGVRWDRQVAVAEAPQALEVGGGGGADDPGRAADGDDVAGQRACRRGRGCLRRGTRDHRGSAPGIRMDALPISQRSPTVAPMTRQRCPNVLRRPILVGSWGVPTTTEFSSTADPVLIATLAAAGAEDGALGDQHPIAKPCAIR